MKRNFFGNNVKNVPGIIYKLRCLGCMHSNQNKRSAVKKTSSETLKSIFLAEVAFLFSTKMKRSILLNITFLSASSNSTLVILLREKKNYLLSSWEMVPVHEEKIVMHKLLSKHHDVMYKKLSPCALPPAV